MIESKKQYSIFKKPISKDNFWNLVFWLGMSTGFSLSLIATKVLHSPYLSSATMWLSFILVPFIVVKNNPVKYDAEAKIFLNSEGQSLKNKHPSSLVWLVLLIALGVAIVSFCENKYNVPEFIFDTFCSFVLFAPACLYFVLLQCPITWLFNKNIWTAKPTSAGYVAPYTRTTSIIDEHLTSPRYYYMSGNRYHSSTRASSDAWNRRHNDIINNPAYSSLSGNIYHRR
jgi:hypothetical protein